MLVCIEMDNLFDLFNQFFSSDFAKDYQIFFIGLLILAVLLGGVLVLLYMKLIYNKSLEAKCEHSEQRLADVQRELSDLKGKYETLKGDYKKLCEDSKLSMMDLEYTAYQKQQLKDGEGLASTIAGE